MNGIAFPIFLLVLIVAGLFAVNILSSFKLLPLSLSGTGNILSDIIHWVLSVPTGAVVTFLFGGVPAIANWIGGGLNIIILNPLAKIVTNNPSAELPPFLGLIVVLMVLSLLLWEGVVGFFKLSHDVAKWILIIIFGFFAVIVAVWWLTHGR